MTEIQHDGKNFVVAIEANQKKGNIEINDIRSVYPKNNGQVVNWINDGLAEYADKKRMAEWLSKQRSNSAEVRKQFNHVTNIIQNFENPSIEDENYVQMMSVSARTDRYGNEIGDGNWNIEPSIYDFSEEYPQVKSKIDYSKTTFNRTNVELKWHCAMQCVILLNSLNRTNVELK